MTNPERDVLIIGFSAGALASLWVGYWLRGRVERWRARHSMKRSYAIATTRDIAHQNENSSRNVSFGELSRDLHIVRRLPEKPRVIPLSRRRIPVVRDEPDVPGVTLGDAERLLDGGGHDLHWSHPDHPANVTARAIRADAHAAMTGAGYGKTAASAALDACTPVERAGGLDTWVAAALRRAVAK